MKETIHLEPEHRDARLTELGLQESILRQAVESGFAQWASCTTNHPPSYPGISAWSETVKTLRDLLVPSGWSGSNESNLPFTVNKENTIAIAVATGDEDTGNPDFSPCTSSSKGPRTAGAIAINNRQLSLFPVDVHPEELQKIQGDGRRMTWLLLFHRDLNRREIRFELSRPTKMSDEAKVDGWIERILFEPIQIDGDVIELPTENSPNAGAIDIEIRRRGLGVIGV